MSHLRATARPATNDQTLPFRVRQREEMKCQIVHDSIHRRPGWTKTFLLEIDGAAVGFGSVAIGGPWKERAAIFEFYVAPEFRTRAFDLFEALLAVAEAPAIEIQSNDPLLAVMFHAHCRDIICEKIVFRDERTTRLEAPGATLRAMTTEEETRWAIVERQGGPEWVVELDGQPCGKGGVLFHYNVPYGDIWMEINEPLRRRGLGAWLVQELKREAYALAAAPCARCSPENVASRRTLAKAGMGAFACMLVGVTTSGNSGADCSSSS